MTPSELQHMGAEKHVDIYVPVGPRVDKVRKLVGGFQGRKKILDVGCATGAILAPFVGRHEIHGVDISEGFTSKAVLAGLKALAHDVESEPLPYPDKTFDVVFSGETIEHTVDTDWMLFELNRVLNPGGLLILTFPNIRTVLSLGMMMFFNIPPMFAARYRSAHYRDFTLRTMKIALQNHGFDFDKAIGCAFFLPKIGEYGSWLATYFPSWSSTTIVVATKARDSVYEREKNIGELY